MEMDEHTFAIWASTILLFGTVIALRLITVLPSINRNPLLLNTHKHKVPEKESIGKEENEKTTKANPANKQHKPIKLLILLGSGGHTGEMIRILKQFHRLSAFKRHYIISSGDSTSIENITKFETLKSDKEKQKAESTSDCKAIKYTKLPRARNIGEGKLLATFHTIYSFAITVLTFCTLGRGEYPDLFLCNGPGTAIPVAYTLFAMKFLGLCKTKIVYVESLARVQQLSLTGLLILPISDRVVVQWKPLARRYRRCEYYGILV